MNHVVVVPYPSRGHINPLLNLCNSLSSRMNQQNRTTVFTVFVTEEWLGFLDPDPTNDIIRFATIPNVLPSERNRGSDMITFLTAVQTKMERPFTEALDRMELPVKLIIADVTMIWPFDVAKMRNIPVAAYSPMSASMFSVMHHVDLLELHHHLFADVSEEYGGLKDIGLGALGLDENGDIGANLLFTGNGVPRELEELDDG
ncbi:hypothetical protein R6Q59_028684 [Mikania micrantha]